ncbi:Hint domain-containing protein [Vannielia litorea]|uniref:Hint domain-containing protein n=1 Tax=Vannielia litorea TaxID=1217970 RepID=A0A1N6FL29_9RHOB|nr:Hint domain-containing protein [Vannielia litorea]SIN95979.1 Hint domain-containing protein [Vannielia litorea]
MTTSPAPSSPSAHRRASYGCHVFSGQDLHVTSGANLGDRLGPTDELCEGDTYGLAEEAEVSKLALVSEAGRLLVAGDSEIGRAGDAVTLAGRLTFMGGDGGGTELVVIELPGPEGGTRHFLPLQPMEPRVDYALIGVSNDPGEVHLSDLTSFAFARGTAITLASGAQRPVEDLAPGDRVLTRDHGAQPVRWIGTQTVRAVGAYAPVVITRDTLGNAADLILSQHQRLFVYQRGADRVTETAEMLVKAALLVDDDAVFVRKGGFVDYFTLVFDHHEVIYAECIPVESLELSPDTRHSLPGEIAAGIEAEFGDLAHTPAFGTEVSGEQLSPDKRRKIFRGSAGR